MFKFLCGFALLAFWVLPFCANAESPAPPAEGPSGTPYIRLSPASLTLTSSSIFTVTVEVSTGSGTTRGGAIVLTFDPADFQVIGPVSDRTAVSGAPFSLSPLPTLGAGFVQIPFLTSSFDLVSYTGPMAEVTFQLLHPSAGSPVTLSSLTSRFAPEIPGTAVIGGVYGGQVTPGPTPTPASSATSGPTLSPTPVSLNGVVDWEIYE